VIVRREAGTAGRMGDAADELHGAEKALEDSAIHLAKSLSLPERATVVRRALEPDTPADARRPSVWPTGAHPDGVRRAEARERQRLKRERDRVTKRNNAAGYGDGQRDSVTSSTGRMRARGTRRSSPSASKTPCAARRARATGRKPRRSRRRWPPAPAGSGLARGTCTGEGLWPRSGSRRRLRRPVARPPFSTPLRGLLHPATLTVVLVTERLAAKHAALPERWTARR
jgi:hypothetical protein